MEKNTWIHPGQALFRVNSAIWWGPGLLHVDDAVAQSGHHRRRAV
jgi:hypothetical protein